MCGPFIAVWCLFSGRYLLPRPRSSAYLWSPPPCQLLLTPRRSPAPTGKDVTPYASSLLPILQHYLTASHAEMLPCRCHATECAGLVLEGLGAAAQAGSAEARALLAASVPGFMQQALQVSLLQLPTKIISWVLAVAWGAV